MTLQPQLADSIKLSELDHYLTNDDWWLTQKLDGERLMIEIEDGKVRGINRSGAIVPPPAGIARVFRGQSGHWIFDGELINNKEYWIFDMPRAMDIITPESTYRERREFISVVSMTGEVNLLPVMTDTVSKITLTKRLIENNAEGMMLNHVDSPYIEGPRRSPFLLKAKLIETIDVVVTEVGRENKRSVAVALYENGREVEVGAVTVTARVLDKLQVGDVIEAKYLYGTQNRLLYQPSFLRTRPDRTPESCLMDQLKIGCKDVIVP